MKFSTINKNVIVKFLPKVISTYFRKMSQNCNIYQVIKAARFRSAPFTKCVSAIGGQPCLEYGDGPDILTKGACGIRFIKYA